jgi:hypothetical protein
VHLANGEYGKATFRHAEFPRLGLAVAARPIEEVGETQLFLSPLFGHVAQATGMLLHRITTAQQVTTTKPRR